MNCATHNDVAAVAYCRTCGKPLCANCTRDVRGVIYCENCLAARLEGALPPVAAVVPPGATPAPTSGPNPTVAGILAGFFPFGVGAVYVGQYAKGLAHLVIFTLLVWGASSAHGPMDTLFGLGIAFFYVYQIIDAVRSAKAIQMGQPAPDPFGLGQTFGTGERADVANIPTGAVILIGLGLLFLLHTLDVWRFNVDRFWPIILIGLGGWLFARRWGLVGPLVGTCSCDRCRTRSLMGPAILVTLGVLFLLDSMDIAGFGRKTWPVLLVVIGLVKIFQRNASAAGHVDVQASQMGPRMPVAGLQEPTQPPSNEVKHV